MAPRVLRISRARFPPERSDEVTALLEQARREIWPKQARLPGYLDGWVGVDRQHGAMVWATLWDGAEHAEALGRLPEMIASGELFRDRGLLFEAITTHELM